MENDAVDCLSERGFNLSSCNASALNESATFFSENDSFERRNPISACVFMIMMGISGFTVNAYILQRVIFRRIFGRLFGWMWISREISLLVSCFLNIAVVGPSFARYPEKMDKSTDLLVGLGLVIDFDQTLLANLMIASADCLLISKPQRFSSIFTPTMTAVMIAMAWILPVVLIPSIELFPICDVHKGRIGAEIYSICAFIQPILSILLSYVILVVTFVVDMSTIWKLTQMSKMSPSKQKQLDVCYMIILQSAVAVPVAFIGIFYTSIFWNIETTLDGLIVIYFTDDLRPRKSFTEDRNANRKRNGSTCAPRVERF